MGESYWGCLIILTWLLCAGHTGLVTTTFTQLHLTALPGVSLQSLDTIIVHIIATQDDDDDDDDDDYDDDDDDDDDDDGGGGGDSGGGGDDGGEDINVGSDDDDFIIDANEVTNNSE